MRDVIQRGELPGEVVRLEKAGRRRRAKADMGGRACDRGQERDRLQHVHEQGRPAPDPKIFSTRGRRIGDEEEIELSPFRQLRDAAIVIDVGRRMGVGFLQ